MSSTTIVRIPIFPFNMVNAHLIKTDEGCILVDAGTPGSQRKFERVLKQHNLSFDDIKLRQLKRQKLKLKEEMQALSQRAN